MLHETLMSSSLHTHGCIQAVTKYQLEASGGGGQLANPRDAFTAPAGHLLLSADYSQVGCGMLSDRLLSAADAADPPITTA